MPFYISGIKLVVFKTVICAFYKPVNNKGCSKSCSRETESGYRL